MTSHKDIQQRLETLGEQWRERPSMTDRVQERLNDEPIAETKQPTSWLGGLTMTQRLTYGSACATIFAFVVFIAFTSSPTVTLAQVVKAMENARYVRWKELEIVKNEWEFLDVDQVEQKKTAYMDLVGQRSRIETHYGASGTFVTITDVKSGKYVMLNPQSKTATVHFSELVMQSAQPKPMRHPFEALIKSEDAKVSKASLNGVDYGYIELVDNNNATPGTTKVWIDRQTLLPFRAEYLLPGEKLRYIYTDYEWTNDLKNADALFRLEVPDDYKTQTITK